VDFSHFDARTNNRGPVDLPRPLRSGLALAAVGLAPLALGLADVIRPLSGLVFAAIFAVVGALRWALAHFELIAIRRRADTELRRELRPHGLSSHAQWRANELTSDRHRIALARAVARTQRDLSPAFLPGASPLNRVAARPHVELFHQLAERLAALDRPVTPQAVLEVQELLTSPESPLYARERASELRSSLFTSLQALDAYALGFPAQSAPASRQSKLTARSNRRRPLIMKRWRPTAATLRAAQSRLRRLRIAHGRR
jgi:hypothetical protein